MVVAEVIGALLALGLFARRVLMKARPRRSVGAFAVACGALAVWFLSSAAYRLAAASGGEGGDVQQSLTGSVYLVSVSLVAASGFLLLRRTATPGWRVPGQLAVLFVAEPAIVAILTATNQHHGLILSSTGGFDPGVGFALHSLYCFGLMFAGVVYLFTRFARGDHSIQKQLVALGLIVIAIMVSETARLHVTPFIVLAAIAWIGSNRIRGHEGGRQATDDPVTRVASRFELDLILDESVERARGEGLPLTMLMVDVDRFKTINDEHGHLVGDEVLAGVARVILREAGPNGVVGRFGGDEFVVVLPGRTVGQALEIAEQIRNSVLDGPVGLSRRRVTVSVGVADYSGGGVGALLRDADARMYQAKRAGGNRVAADT